MTFIIRKTENFRLLMPQESKGDPQYQIAWGQVVIHQKLSEDLPIVFKVCLAESSLSHRLKVLRATQ